ncbi:MAG: TlpA family protein disulfide reductase [Deltaproteobacteria bacterium]|nr:MAG: TlpA family protein disulfide reductase [Deltaproteobacteria bacterium]
MTEPTPPAASRPWPTLALAAIGLLLVISLVQYFSEDPDDPGLHHPLVGTSAHALDLPGIDHDSHPLWQPGQLSVIDFWSLTCGPCTRMRPELQHLARRHRGALHMASVNTDPPADRRADRVSRYAREHGIGWPTLLDDGDAQIAYGVRRIPAIFIVDEQGTIRRGYSGVTSARTLDAALRRIPEEP